MAWCLHVANALRSEEQHLIRLLPEPVQLVSEHKPFRVRQFLELLLKAPELLRRGSLDPPEELPHCKGRAPLVGSRSLFPVHTVRRLPVTLRSCGSRLHPANCSW